MDELYVLRHRERGPLGTYTKPVDAGLAMLRLLRVECHAAGEQRGCRVEVGCFGLLAEERVRVNDEEAAARTTDRRRSLMAGEVRARMAAPRRWNHCQ